MVKSAGLVNAPANAHDNLALMSDLENGKRRTKPTPLQQKRMCFLWLFIFIQEATGTTKGTLRHQTGQVHRVIDQVPSACAQGSAPSACDPITFIEKPRIRVKHMPGLVSGKLNLEKAPKPCRWLWSDILSLGTTLIHTNPVCCIRHNWICPEIIEDL